jgi:hypothetical protein
VASLANELIDGRHDVLRGSDFPMGADRSADEVTS